MTDKEYAKKIVNCHSFYRGDTNSIVDAITVLELVHRIKQEAIDKCIETINIEEGKLNFEHNNFINVEKPIFNMCREALTTLKEYIE